MEILVKDRYKKLWHKVGNTVLGVLAEFSIFFLMTMLFRPHWSSETVNGVNGVWFIAVPVVYPWWIYCVPPFVIAVALFLWLELKVGSPTQEVNNE